MRLLVLVAAEFAVVLGSLWAETMLGEYKAVIYGRGFSVHRDFNLCLGAQPVHRAVAATQVLSKSIRRMEEAQCALIMP